MSLPFDMSKVLEFIGWMKARNLKSKTMSTYLSGVRMYHISMGHNEPGLRQPIVKLILKGQSNMERIQKMLMGKVGRLPVTIKVMKLIKVKLSKVNWPMAEVRLFWAVVTMAWAGSFRIHELVSRTESMFDEQIMLQWKNVKFSKVKADGRMICSVSVHIKSPKIDRVGAGDNIEVVELNNFMCPVTAMQKYRDISSLGEEPAMPVFRLPSGSCFTGAEVNKRLRQLTGFLGEHITGGVVTSHSFRAGVATEMARSGFTEDELMAVGRWSGPSYRHYLSLPLSHRAMFARKIALGV